MNVCKVDGCGQPHEARGWCGKHYSRWKRHGDPLKTLTKPKQATTGNEQCSIDGCTRPKDTRGWCRLHYGRWQRHGNPLQEPDYSRTPEERAPVEIPEHLASFLTERRQRLQAATSGFFHAQKDGKA